MVLEFSIFTYMHIHACALKVYFRRTDRMRSMEREGEKNQRESVDGDKRKVFVSNRVFEA